MILMVSSTNKTDLHDITEILLKVALSTLILNIIHNIFNLHDTEAVQWFYFMFAGHNWGSEHDPTSGSCAPSSIMGNGKYLMYPYSVTGEDSNNDVSF